jgi:hypothetical protein
MKTTARIILTMILAVFAMPTLNALQATRSRFDPAPAGRIVPHNDFWDRVSKGINPAGIDYGERIEETRQGILDDTLRDSSFRFEAVLALALVGMWLLYWWECRITGNLRFSASRAVVACQNELASVRGRNAKLEKEYAEAGRILNERMENPAAAKPQQAKSRNESSSIDLGQGTANPEQQLAEAKQMIAGLNRQVAILTRKYEEEQQKNRKLMGG